MAKTGHPHLKLASLIPSLEDVFVYEILRNNRKRHRFLPRPELIYFTVSMWSPTTRPHSESGESLL